MNCRCDCVDPCTVLADNLFVKREGRGMECNECVLYKRNEGVGGVNIISPFSCGWCGSSCISGDDYGPLSNDVECLSKWSFNKFDCQEQLLQITPEDIRGHDFNIK